MASLPPTDPPPWFPLPSDSPNLIAAGLIPPSHPNHVAFSNDFCPNDAVDSSIESQLESSSVPALNSLNFSSATGLTSNVQSTEPEENLESAIQYYLNGNLDQYFPEDRDGSDSGNATDVNDCEEDTFSDCNNESLDGSNAPSTSSNHSAEAKIKYDLRLGPRLAANNAFNSTWIDNDQSGDYDPSSAGVDVQRLLQSQQRRKRPLRDIFGNEDEIADQENAEKRAKPKSSALRRRHGDHFVVTLKVDAERGRKLLEQHDDNWPLEDSWSVFDKSLSDVDNGQWYHLRDRRNSGSQQDYTRYANHPEARGCRSCLSLGVRCSLLDPESSYPCDDCAGESYDCELVMPSRFKRACENCKSRRKQCSYTTGGDHGEPCEGCQEQGWRCVAGPAIDPSRVRIGHDGSPVSLYGGGKHISSSCTPCKQLKKSCSIRSGDRPPCANCKVDGEDCHFGRARQKRRVTKKKLTTENLNIRRQTRAQSPVRSTSQVSLRQNITRDIPKAVVAKDGRPTKALLQPHMNGRIIFIKTKLPHPITFNAVRIKDEPCHWCTDPIIGLLGLGLRRVKVLEWSNGKGYTELGGGHTNDGVEPCRMCADCTLQRVFIALCPLHVMRSLKTSSPLSVDVNVLAARLQQCRTPVEVHQTCDYFCSICPSIAVTECWTEHDTSMFGENRKPTRGCGLRLCETCQVLFDQVYGRDLQVMLDQITVDPNWYPHGLRPDSDFLKHNSQMLKQL